MLPNMSNWSRWKLHCLGALFAAALAAGACSSDDADPACQQIVHIEQLQLEPATAKSLVLDRGVPGVFDARVAAKTSCPSGGLHYAWHADLAEGSGAPPQLFRVCDDNPLCFLSACKAFSNAGKDANHKVLLVVSDQTLPTDAQSPFGFPAGAAFDFVEWQVDLNGECVN